jgi:hypothetical protein
VQPGHRDRPLISQLDLRVVLAPSGPVQELIGAPRDAAVTGAPEDDRRVPAGAAGLGAALSRRQLVHKEA